MQLNRFWGPKSGGKPPTRIDPPQINKVDRAFSFRYGDVSTPSQTQETFVVKVFANPNQAVGNDLVSQLSSQLSHPGVDQKVIYEPSEVVAFQLVTQDVQPLPTYSAATGGSGSKTEHQKFRYPKSIYLDQCLSENAELTTNKRAQHRDMTEEIRRLAARKQALTVFKASHLCVFVGCSLCSLSLRYRAEIV